MDSARSRNASRRPATPATTTRRIVRTWITPRSRGPCSVWERAPSSLSTTCTNAAVAQCQKHFHTHHATSRPRPCVHNGAAFVGCSLQNDVSTRAAYTLSTRTTEQPPWCCGTSCVVLQVLKAEGAPGRNDQVIGRGAAGTPCCIQFG